MPKKRTDYIASLYYSFFSSSFYRSVARERKGLCLGYLLFILFLFWIPEISRIDSELTESLSAEAPKYVRQMPVITVEKGKVSVKEPTPYYIYDPVRNTPVAIIDTSGQITSLKNTGAQVLLTERQVLIKNGPSGVRTFDLADIDRLVIDRKLIYEWIDTLTALFPVVLFPFLLLFSFLYYLLLVLFAASLGTLFAKRFRTVLDFKALMRLSVVSFTPAILLQAVHAVLDIAFPFRAPLSFLITLGYLYYGIGCNSEAKGQGSDRTS